jgi:hypothetical protein
LRQSGFRSRDLGTALESYGLSLSESTSPGARPIGLSTIEAAADRWARDQRQRQRAQGLRWSREFFVQMATDWLHFLGRLEVATGGDLRQIQCVSAFHVTALALRAETLS